MRVGVKLSESTLKDDLNKYIDCISYKIECPTDAHNPGGINIFGDKFGNCNQNIKFKCYYK